MGSQTSPLRLRLIAGEVDPSSGAFTYQDRRFQDRRLVITISFL